MACSVLEVNVVVTTTGVYEVMNSDDSITSVSIVASVGKVRYLELLATYHVPFLEDLRRSSRGVRECSRWDGQERAAERRGELG